MRRKKKPKQPVAIPIPHQGIWIKANMDENGGVTWTCNYPNAQRFSNLYAAVKEWCHGLNIKTTKKALQNQDHSPAHWTTSDVKTREFKGAMAAALKAFNSRSHRRRFGVWFEIHTAPLDRAYVAWKLARGSGTLEYVASQTDPNKQYTISGEGSNLSCTCPAFKFCKMSVKMCKHIRTYISRGGP